MIANTERPAFYPPAQSIEIVGRDPVRAGAVSLMIRDAHGQLFALHVQTQRSYDDGLLQASREQSGVGDPEEVFIVAATAIDEQMLHQIVYGVDPDLLASYLIPQVEG
ncbi:MAG TPA: hypothetical protein VGO07_07600 [Candidatus Saccharimonadales bacterium]|jgi:hypothetical protein|nr:hypothetical protein [Candidatus Saccharimonadales bacterium]